MAREITHLLIADMLAERVGELRLRGPINGNPNSFRFGTIVHDLLYFDLRRDPPTKKLARIIHGEGGENTFDVIRAAAENPEGGSGGQAMMAFILGMVLHTATDAVFHPYIFHETGHPVDDDPKEKSRVDQAHRRLETIVDMCLYDNVHQKNEFSIARIVENLEIGPEDLLGVLCRFGKEVGVPVDMKGCLSCLDLFIRIQGITRTRWLANAVCTLEPLLPRYVREGTALVYADRLRVRLKGMTSPITYVDPATGEVVLSSLAKMLEDSVSEGIRRMEELLGALSSPEDLSIIVWPPL